MISHSQRHTKSYKKLSFDLQNYIRFGVPRCQRLSHASEITRYTSSFMTHLRLSASGVLPVVDTEAEVDALEAAIPLLEPSSTVAMQASKH